MQYRDIQDSSGKTIGFEIVDDNGNVIGGTNGSLPGVPSPLAQSEELTVLQGNPDEPRSGTGGSTSNSRLPGSSTAGDEGRSVLQGEPEGVEQTDGRQRLDRMRSARGQLEPPKPKGVGGYLSRVTGRGINAMLGAELTPLGNDSQADLQRRVSEGGLRGLTNRLELGRRAVVAGAVDAVQDFTDFGAAVLDTIRGREVDDSDNFFQPSRFVEQPDSNLGKAGREIVSFGAGAIPVVGALSKVSSVSKLRSGGVASRAAYGALTGSVTDFIKAKQGEDNLYDAVRGTPLETPLSEFFAGDEDDGVLMTKLKEAAGGVPLGIGFDLASDALGAALKSYKAEPLAALADGIKKAKQLPEAEQPRALLKAAEDADQVTQNEVVKLKAVLESEVSGKVTEARRMLAGTLDGTEEEGLINAELLDGISGGDDGLSKLNLYEEIVVDLEDLRTSLYGLENDEITNQAIKELDETIFEAQSSIDRASKDLQTLSRRDSIQREIDKIDSSLEDSIDRPASNYTPKQVPESSDRFTVEIEEGGGSKAKEFDSSSLSDISKENLERVRRLADEDDIDPSAIPSSELVGFIARDTPSEFESQLKELVDAGALSKNDDGSYATVFSSDFVPSGRSYTSTDESTVLKIVDSDAEDNLSEVSFTVDGELSNYEGSSKLSTDQGRENTRRTLDVLRMFREDLSTRPDGFIYETRTAVGDGLKDRRVEIYKRAGFGDLVDNGLEDSTQRGVVVEGKLYPVNKDTDVDALISDVKSGRIHQKTRRAKLEGELNSLEISNPGPTSNVSEPPGGPLATRDPGSPGVLQRDNVGPGPRPDRQPNLHSSGPRKPRSKQEIRQEIASKRTKRRLDNDRKTTSTRANVQKTQSISKAEGYERAVKSAKSVDDVLNLDSNRSVGTDRYINTSKLTDSTEVAGTVREVINGLDDKFIQDSISRPRILREAKRFFEKHADLSPKEVDAAFLAMANSTANLPRAIVAARMGVKDLAEQVNEAFAKVDLKVSGSKVSTDQMVLENDALYKLSRLELFVATQKKLGKIAGQSLNFAGIDLSDINVNNIIKQAEYDDLLKKVEADPELQSINEYFRELQELGRTKAGRQKIRETVTDILSAGGDLDQIMEASKASRFSIMAERLGRGKDLAMGVRMSGMLSGTRTHLTNFVSGMVNTVYVPATQIVGATLDAGVNKMRGNADAVSVDMDVIRESMAQLAGLHMYIQDSALMARKAFKSGYNILETNSSLREDVDFFDILNPNTGSSVMDGAIKFLGLPSKLLLTGDEFVKQLNYRSHVGASALRDGMDKGLQGKELSDHVAFMVDQSLGVNPDTGIKGLALDQGSLDHAKYVTFQTDITSDNSYLRKGVLDVVEGMRKNPVMATFSQLFLPFVKTPLNIMAYTARNSPLAVTSKAWQKDFAKGGAARAKAIGEFAVGSSALMGMISFGMEGRLTGRPPKDKKARQVWFENGYKPYSIKIGNKWMSYQRMEPFATHLAIVGDITSGLSQAGAKYENDAGALMQAVTMAFVESTKDKTFFEGISKLMDVIDAVGNPEKGWTIDRAAQEIAVSFAPYGSLLNEYRKAVDPQLREVEGLVDRFMNRIPGYSDDLPAQYSWLTGKPIVDQANPIFNLYPSSQFKDDPVMGAMLKYNVGLTPPSEKIKGIKLSSEQYSRLNQISGTVEIDGKTRYQALAEALGRADLDFSNEELRYIQMNGDYANDRPLAKELRKINSEYNKVSKSYLLREFPELTQQIRQTLLEKENVKEGTFFFNEPLGGDKAFEIPEELLQSQQETTESVDKKINKLLN